MRSPATFVVPCPYAYDARAVADHCERCSGQRDLNHPTHCPEPARRRSCIPGALARTDQRCALIFMAERPLTGLPTPMTATGRPLSGVRDSHA